MSIQTENLEIYSWVKGPKVEGAMVIGDCAILAHVGGGAYSVVRGSEYLACTPNLQRAMQYIRRRKPATTSEVAA